MHQDYGMTPQMLFLRTPVELMGLIVISSSPSSGVRVLYGRSETISQSSCGWCLCSMTGMQAQLYCVWQPAEVSGHHREAQVAVMQPCNASAHTQSVVHRIIELSRLEKTFEIIKSNH